MDLLYFLKSRLTFIEQLYDGAVSSFIETKGTIDAGEPPYVDSRNPEDYDGEPAFLSEWEQADDSVRVIGYWCLCAVQGSLQAYLKAYVGPSGAVWWNDKHLERELRDKPRKASWFEKYRLLFLDDLGIDWTSGPVSLDELEQLNLTRNDLNHNVDVMSLSVSRTSEHATRFPEGLFTDELWRRDGVKFCGIDTLKVDKAKLSLAIKLVEEFCAWLEGIRCRYPHYIKETHGIDLLAARRTLQARAS